MADCDDHTVTFTAPEVILLAATSNGPRRSKSGSGSLKRSGCHRKANRSRQDRGLSPVASGQRATVTLWTQDTAKAYRALTDLGVLGRAAPSVWLGQLIIGSVQDTGGHPVQLVQRVDGHA